MTFKMTSEFGKKHVSGRVSHFLLEVAMAMTKCWECSARVSDSASECPKCGAKQNGEPKTTTEKIVIALIIIAIPVLLVALFIAPIIIAFRNISGG